MEFIKELRKISNSIHVISFRKKEVNSKDMRIGDILRVKVEVLKKAFKCNTCNDGICYIDLESTPNLTEDLEIECSDLRCKNKQLLKDSISYEEWLNNKGK